MIDERTLARGDGIRDDSDPRVRSIDARKDFRDVSTHRDNRLDPFQLPPHPPGVPDHVEMLEEDPGMSPADLVDEFVPRAPDIIAAGGAVHRDGDGRSARTPAEAVDIDALGAD